MAGSNIIHVKFFAHHILVYVYSCLAIEELNCKLHGMPIKKHHACTMQSSYWVFNCCSGFR